jgi:hypothetical protein
MDPALRRDSGEAAALLADEFYEFGASGRVWMREEILTPTERVGPIVGLEDFAARMLAPGLAQATFRSLRVAPDGKPFTALRRSPWIYRDGRRQMIFHQGTKVLDA